MVRFAGCPILSAFFAEMVGFALSDRLAYG